MNWKDPEKVKKYSADKYIKTRKGSFRGRINDLVYGARKRAKKQRIEFSITTETFKEQTHCSIFKQNEFNFSATNKKRDPNSMSIDRIDPRKGYTPDNVWLISMRANRIKNDATPEELRLIADAVEERLKSHAKGE